MTETETQNLRIELIEVKARVEKLEAQVAVLIAEPKRERPEEDPVLPAFNHENALRHDGADW